MDPLGSLVEWIAVYGMLGLIAVGLAERFIPALPSHGALVAIGIASINGAWSLSVAIAATTVGSFLGALFLYFIARALGQVRSARLLSTVGRLLRISPLRTETMLSRFRGQQSSFAFVSQMVPTVRLLTPLAAGLLSTDFRRFAAGTVLGIALWNSFFVVIGSLAARARPDVNASALAIKFLLFLLAAEALIALVWRLAQRHRRRRVLGDVL